MLSTSSVLTFGLLWGAFASALLSRQFAVKIPPPIEVVKAAIGGTLMGLGAALAWGCNVGGFFSATSALSLSGLMMMLGLIVGVFLEVRYLYWELTHLRFKRGEGRPRNMQLASLDLKQFQPLMGALAATAALIAAFVYFYQGNDASSGYDYAKMGGLLIAGLAFGVILHRSRFAFLQAFREPFTSGNAAQFRGMAIAVIVSVIGFAALKAGGLRPEGAYVAPTFWAGSFIGGILFGFGMPFAGGCASGACWRAAEGSVKLVIAFIFMGVTNSLGKLLLDSSPSLSSLMGREIFLPEYVSYYGAVALIVTVMILFWLITAWNEKTRALI